MERRNKWLLILMILVSSFGLSYYVWSINTQPVSAVADCGNIQAASITYDGSEYVGGKGWMFTYTVTSKEQPAISHVTFSGCAFNEYTVVETSAGVPDINDKIEWKQSEGWLKFDEGYGDNEVRTIWFIINSEYGGTTGDIGYLFKGGSDCIKEGTITGPVCETPPPETGTIIVEKQTDPDGDSTSFTFTGDVTGTIIDGAQLKVSGLQPGTYTSSETVPAGWTLTSIAFDDVDSTGDLSTGTATFELQAGEIVTAVFTNTADQEPEPDPTKITITKETNPGSSNEFNFIDHDLNPFTLRDYNTEGDVWDQELEPGTYTFEELLEPGWTLDNININGDDDSGSIIDLPNRKITIDLDAEEWISVWFTNSKDPETGTIIVEKQTIPDGHTRDFDFTGDVSGTIRDGEQIVVSGLAPGTYTSTEIVPSNWKLDEITVDDDNSEVDKPNKKVTFKLEEGETIKAVFTNEKEDEPDPWEAKIKARKVDSNGDPIEGWMISLFQIDKYTNSNGWVEFTVVEPQTYTLIEETRSGWIPSGDTIVEITVTEEKTYTHTFRNEKVPDFVIPEYPLGTILSLITMMTALIISQNKHKIHL